MLSMAYRKNKSESIQPDIDIDWAQGNLYVL